MNRLINISKYIFREIGPYMGFYLLAQFFNQKIALIVSVIFICCEYIFLKFKKQKIGMLFYTFNAVIIVFAILEFLNIKTNIYQYEALLTNLIIGLFWSASVFKEKSVVQEIAESQGRTSVETSVDKKFFFNCFTIFWSFYFISKGLFYFWMYQLPEIHRPIVVRLIVGKISFLVMMAISLLLPEKIWALMNRFQLLSSSKMKNKNMVKA
jgi:hypothetical protein